MERRKFISKGLAAGVIIPATYATLLNSEAQGSKTTENKKKKYQTDYVFIEHSVEGRP